jgi:crotonobetainyl-CoA:carnitine CoA-transferase CaiB-like acyl-CoA transferase
MAQAAASWLITSLPLLDLGYGPEEVRRSGNEHREFVPVNVYPTADGYVYLAIGNDVQWARLVSIEAFAGLASPLRETNEGRRSERDSLHEEIAAITRGRATSDLVDLFRSTGLVTAPIRTVPEVAEAPPVREALLETNDASGRPVRLPPPSVEREHLTATGRRLPYAPAYGAHTNDVLKEAGFAPEEIEELRRSGTVA